jgi:hypothetical protein
VAAYGGVPQDGAGAGVIAGASNSGDLGHIQCVSCSIQMNGGSGGWMGETYHSSENPTNDPLAIDGANGGNGGILCGDNSGCNISNCSIVECSITMNGGDGGFGITSSATIGTNTGNNSIGGGPGGNGGNGGNGGGAMGANFGGTDSSKSYSIMNVQFTIPTSAYNTGNYASTFGTMTANGGMGGAGGRCGSGTSADTTSSAGPGGPGGLGGNGGNGGILCGSGLGNGSYNVPILILNCFTLGTGYSIGGVGGAGGVGGNSLESNPPGNGGTGGNGGNGGNGGALVGAGFVQNTQTLTSDNGPSTYQVVNCFTTADVAAYPGAGGNGGAGGSGGGGLNVLASFATTAFAVTCAAGMNEGVLALVAMQNTGVAGQTLNNAVQTGGNHSGDCGISGAHGNPGFILGDNCSNIAISNAVYSGAMIEASMSNGTTSNNYVYMSNLFIGATSNPVWLNYCGNLGIDNGGTNPTTNNGYTTGEPSSAVSDAATYSTSTNRYSTNLNNSANSNLWAIQTNSNSGGFPSNFLMGAPNGVYVPNSQLWSIPLNNTTITSALSNNILTNFVSSQGQALFTFPSIITLTLTVNDSLAGTTGTVSLNTPYQNPSAGGTDTTPYSPILSPSMFTGINKPAFELSQTLSTSPNITYFYTQAHANLPSEPVPIVLPNCAVVLNSFDILTRSAEDPGYTTVGSEPPTSPYSSVAELQTAQAALAANVQVDELEAQFQNDAEYEYTYLAYGYSISGSSEIINYLTNPNLPFSVDTNGAVSINAPTAFIQGGKYILWIQVTQTNKNDVNSYNITYTCTNLNIN